MANTVIQLKWSEATSTPSTLNVAEPAYSNTSGKLFIGQAGNQVIAVGGKYYTDIVDAATDANTASKLVKRDAAGGFVATFIHAKSLYGNANTATIWQTARNIGVSGDATGIVSVDGSANANIPLTLVNTAVTAGDYGSVTQIPSITIDSKGRITRAANVSISTTLAIAGDGGTDSVALASDTLTFAGANGVTTTVVAANTTVMIDVDNTVMRTWGGQTIGGDLSISGNLTISGNQVIQDVETIKTEDPLIELAANNAADLVDIGFYGSYASTGTKYTAFVRDASDSGKFKLLTAGTTLPTTVVDPAAFTRGTLVADITGGTVSSLTSAINVADGGTGVTSITAGRIIIGNGTSGVVSLANTGTAGTYGSASYHPVITTDAWGRVSSVSNTQIAIDTSLIISGTLGVARGGTGSSSFTVKGVVVSDASSTTGALTSLTSSTEGHILQINSAGTPSFGHLNGGVF